MRSTLIILSLFIGVLFSVLLSACSTDEEDPKENLQLFSVKIADKMLNLSDFTENTGVAFDEPILINFSAPINENSASEAIALERGESLIETTITLINDGKTISVQPEENLAYNTTYTLTIDNSLKGANKEIFSGISLQFKTAAGELTLSSVKIGETIASPTNRIKDIDLMPTIELTFQKPVNVSTVTSATIGLLGHAVIPGLSITFSEENKKVTLTATTSLEHLSRYLLYLSPEIEGDGGEVFTGYAKNFYTEVDHTPKMPLLPNDEDNDNDNTNDLLSVVQKQTFKYFYDFAHPTSGMARERNTSGNTVTSGGSGFGIMALIVGMERNFITQQQGLDHMNKIVTFLEGADRFNGAWSHWINGSTGKVIPFSTNDNGGDLVETAFLVEGLITFRQYLTVESIPDTYDLVNRINTLWQGVDWEWYRKEANENVLYWHWSPDKAWAMNHQIKGWNECMITYVLAASAPNPAYTIPPIVYESGWASSGGIRNGNSYEGITLPLGGPWGGPLFFTHYSFVGMNPTNLLDQYANYWTQNVNHSLINYRYCVRNPKNFVGYSEECWGLTASDNHVGYNAHSPTNDLGVITPTAALSSFPYTPTESMKALKFFYYTMGDRLWGDYGFYDAFNVTESWYASSYLAIDQGPIVVMIENYRTGLLWNLFMSAPEIQAGLDKLGFTY